MQSDVNKTELYSDAETERNLEGLCDCIDESPAEASR